MDACDVVGFLSTEREARREEMTRTFDGPAMMAGAWMDGDPVL
jgi:hypothetical protein